MPAEGPRVYTLPGFARKKVQLADNFYCVESVGIVHKISAPILLPQNATVYLTPTQHEDYLVVSQSPLVALISQDGWHVETWTSQFLGMDMTISKRGKVKPKNLKELLEFAEKELHYTVSEIVWKSLIQPSLGMEFVTSTETFRKE